MTEEDEKAPDYCYDPDDWEVTFEWDNRDLVIEDGHAASMDTGEVKRISTLLEGPDVFAVNVVTRRDEEGDPEEYELQWFSDEEAARVASKF